MSENKLKIALVGPTHPFRGGIAHHTTFLERALRQRHEVEFRSFTRQYPLWLYPGESDREESDGGPRPADVRYTLDSVNPWTWYRTAREIADARPDIAIVPWWVVFWAPQFVIMTRYLSWLHRVPVVFFCHNVQEHETSKLKQLATRLVLSGGDGFICQSEEEAATLSRWFPDRVVKKVFHPTYAPLGQNAQAAGERPNGDECRGDDAPRLLFFGFVREYKGLDILLRAMPEIHRRTGATLRIVGETWKSPDSYLELISRLGLEDVVDCDFRYVPSGELDRVFGRCDLVVLPYRSATGCGVLQLAFGFGKPVVATRVGGIGESVEAEVNGILVEPQSVEALTEGVVRALEPDRLQRLGEGVTETASRFSWGRLVDAVEEVAAGLRRPTRQPR
jgi:glycosyltransferase involved in cell wall biosynthesis